jgi:hypothetical protein
MNRKYLAKLCGVGIAVVAAVAMMASVAQAQKPATGYSQFAGCPTIAEDSTVSSCIHSSVESGYLKLGNKNTPIENAIPLTGGVNENLGEFKYNSEGGLKPVRQKVPGGIIGLTGLTWLAEFLGIEALTLYAVTELAGTPEFHNINEITLPIKVHLENSTGVLGPKCYVGSSSSPIVLNLTTGTSGKLTGHVPHFEFDFEKEILHVREGTYVDNKFSAPGATGCTLTLFGFIPISLNGLVNLQSGLPAASGTNETVQHIETELVEVGLVYP